MIEKSDRVGGRPFDPAMDDVGIYRQDNRFDVSWTQLCCKEGQ